jgi:formylglycine-generating enzyme required for sulfatase activity
MVSGFRLDEYDVTVGRFRQFVNTVLPPDGGTGWTPPEGSGKHTHLNGGQGLVDLGTAADAGNVYEPGWLASWDSYVASPLASSVASCDGVSTWTPSPGTQENLPINCVNWYEAYAFCIWDGGFLPSAMEGEYAAAGGSQQRVYPWGSTEPGVANQYAIYGDSPINVCYYPGGDAGTCTGLANIAPVGTPTLGAGLWGQLDLVGNVGQWNLDSLVNYYAIPCADCIQSTIGNSAGIRSADALYYGTLVLHSFFLGANDDATTLSSAVGFRCARSP